MKFVQSATCRYVVFMEESKQILKKKERCVKKLFQLNSIGKSVPFQVNCFVIPFMRVMSLIFVIPLIINYKLAKLISLS